MKNGTYHTKAGSTVVVSGKYSGRFDISFDWLEESGACIDCSPSVEYNMLVWSCLEHEGGSAELIEVENNSRVRARME